MEVVDDDRIKDIVREELSKLGIQESPTGESKKMGYGAKFLNKTVQGGIGRAGKSKKKSQMLNLNDSPINLVKIDGKKNGAKSPFASSKSRNSTKKKNIHYQNFKVFGRPLSECSTTVATLPDSNTVHVPGFLVDACNVLRHHIALEGLFRKAGSSARQNEIKRIIDSGNDLPSDVHPIDVACLLKQFFRCLPQPLLEPAVHSHMLRCQLGLCEAEARVMGLMLCTLLLSTPSQHSLVYFLNFLHEVVSHSENNRMDAYNLAVVLSPNLLPMTVTGTQALHCHSSTNPAVATAAMILPQLNKQGGRGAGGSSGAVTLCLSISDDSVLSANIDIMQELITHQHRVCRLPCDVVAGLLAERSVPLDGGGDVRDGLPSLAPAPTAAVAGITSKSKKRRSASMHRLMSGLRRVVGGQSVPPSLPSTHTPNSPHPQFHQHRVTPHPPTSPMLSHFRLPASPLLFCSPLSCSPRHPLTPGGFLPPTSLSLHPMAEEEARKGGSLSKRKSDVLLPTDCGSMTEQPSKRQRVGEREAAETAPPLSYAAVAAAAPKHSQEKAHSGSITSIKVRRSHTAREVSSSSHRSSTRATFPRHPSLAAFLDPRAAAVLVGSSKGSKSGGGTKKRSPSRILNSNLSGKLAEFGDKFTGRGEKTGQRRSAGAAGSSVRRRDLAVEEKIKSDIATLHPSQTANAMQTVHNVKVTLDIAKENTNNCDSVDTVNLSNKKTSNSERHQPPVQDMGTNFTVIDCRPLYKSLSEVIPRLTYEASPYKHSQTTLSPRTPLKDIKAHGALKSQTTPNLSSKFFPVASTSSTTLLPHTGSGTMTVATLSGTPAAAGGHQLHQSSSLTPRNSTGRGSKRARRKARNARLAMLSAEPDGEASDCSIGTPARLNITTPVRGVGRSSAVRGVPDGAECTLRDLPAPVLPKLKGGSALHHLEEQYDTIKTAVDAMEMDIDNTALRDMKQSSLFGDEIASIVSLNHNEIIQSAYDRIEKESNLLSMSPSESLCRRLDRELKIRRRRSGEGRVVRSPSERKIGVIRRRSKELELKINKANVSATDDKTFLVRSVNMVTPKLKDPLVKSPLSHSLKRGRPNSVRCGLPIIVRTNAVEKLSADAAVSLENSLSVSTDCNDGSIIFYDENKLAKDTAIEKGFSRQSLSSVAAPRVSVASSGSSRNKSSSINSMSSVDSSPGNNGDHFVPYLKPGVNTEGFVASVDFDDEAWVAASDFLEQVGDSQSIDVDLGGDASARKQKDGNRPSIAALKKQKKVTANVQLFNQLGTTSITPSQQRRQSRLYTTPVNACRIPCRSTASERRRSQYQQTHRTSTTQQRMRGPYRASLTPRHLGAALRHHRTPSKVAVVSPLKENRANIGALEQSYGVDDGVFKTPGQPSMTPSRGKHSAALKAPGFVLEMQFPGMSSDVFL